jgi:hypothetical protein
LRRNLRQHFKRLPEGALATVLRHPGGKVRLHQGRRIRQVIEGENRVREALRDGLDGLEAKA